MSQRTPNIQVETRTSPIHGRGLFAVTPMAARRKLGEFIGEYISQSEARSRAKRSEVIAIVELNSSWAIDASVGGNEFRYVNHSCKPNIFMRRCYKRVEFYALRNISSGEELTCDYGETHHNGALRCTCLSSNCRGYI
jgi:SET domain-containing protein